MLAPAHEPINLFGQRRRDRAGAVVEISLEIGVGEAHLGFVGLTDPETRARRLLDDRRRDAQLARELAHLALHQVADRQEIDAAVAVLREVAEHELAAVAGTGDEVVQRVGDEIERGHPQPRLDVDVRQPRADVVGGAAAGTGNRRRRIEQARDQRVVRLREIDPQRPQLEVIGDEPRVRLVPRVAVTRHQDADDFVVGRNLREPGDDRRIDTAAETHDEPARAAFSRGARASTPRCDPLEKAWRAYCGTIQRVTVPATIGRYRVLKTLGEGGMGVVYAAHDDRLDRPIAIKMMRASDALARERLLREARAAAKLTHANICRTYEIGEADGELFIAMELLEGESLAARLLRGPMTVTEAAPTALAILDALGALHAAGLVHRDLKPSNIFLTPGGVKLLDFGLARETVGLDAAARPASRSLGSSSARRTTWRPSRSPATRPTAGRTCSRSARFSSRRWPDGRRSRARQSSMSFMRSCTSSRRC